MVCKAVLVAGARPNFVKLAPIRRELTRRERFGVVVVHTGQHYDDPMSAAFFRDLNIPEPECSLGVGSASHAVQTARIMEAFDGFLDREPADVVIVVGDVNSTVAAALTAVKRSVPVAHVEAGLRSFDRTMPEEINRIVTDAVSSLLFTPSLGAGDNLLREGRPADRIHFVGNVMVDTLLDTRARAEESSDVLRRFGLGVREYAVLTLHRPANVDDPETLRGIVRAVRAVGEEIPVIYPMHPRSRRMMAESGLSGEPGETRGLMLVDPLGYLDFLKLEANARLVMTDSGGIQEETTVLGVPCLTLRPNTERPVTVSDGTNRVVGTERASIESAARRVLSESMPATDRVPPLWDGGTSVRIADVLEEWFAAGTPGSGGVS